MRFTCFHANVCAIRGRWFIRLHRNTLKVISVVERETFFRHPKAYQYPYDVLPAYAYPFFWQRSRQVCIHIGTTVFLKVASLVIACQVLHYFLGWVVKPVFMKNREIPLDTSAQFLSFLLRYDKWNHVPKPEVVYQKYLHFRFTKCRPGGCSQVEVQLRVHTSINSTE